MDIKWQITAYRDMDRDTLYAIMRLRQEVFIVEQNCVYLDADSWDCIAWHVLAWDEEILVATTRLLPPGYHDYCEHCIGRVATAKSHRGRGVGKEIMKRSLDFLSQDQKVAAIRISAQTYLDKFYSELGFVGLGEEYLEDDMPHREMLWTSPASE